MGLDIKVFQDGDDVVNGVVQLVLTVDRCNCTIYFSLVEWIDFQKAIAKFEYGKTKGDIHPEETTNPLSFIGQDGYAVQIEFFDGVLNADLYFENPKHHPNNVQWKHFKKQILAFKPTEEV